MSAAQPSTSAATGQITAVSAEPREIRTGEWLTIFGLVAIAVVMGVFDYVYFPQFDITTRVAVFTGEAELWVAVAILLEVWLHFLDYRMHTTPGRPTTPPPPAPAPAPVIPPTSPANPPPSPPAAPPL